MGDSGHGVGGRACFLIVLWFLASTQAGPIPPIVKLTALHETRNPIDTDGPVDIQSGFARLSNKIGTDSSSFFEDINKGNYHESPEDLRLKRDIEKRHGFDSSIGTTDLSSPGERSFIPNRYLLNIKFPGVVNQTQLDDLRHGLAQSLRINRHQVHVATIKVAEQMVSVFVTDMHGGLIPARRITAKLSSVGLNSHLHDVHVSAVHSREIIVDSPDAWTVRAWPFIPYVAVGVGLVIISVAAAIVIFCLVKQKKTSEASLTQQIPSSVMTKQICLLPPAKPDLVKNSSPIQPDSHPVYLQKGCITPIQTPPMKLKAKGLLERRGSNASLTLELNPTHDTPAWGSPPRECSAEEYLMSAGNRLSRKQLRNSLKQLRLLYEEFWEIPMNHPDRVVVPGSGTKNRYRTIIPNEMTRVQLEEIDSDHLSTYINANFIKGYAGEPQAYIATQGPMSHTVIDFWRMVWQEKVPIIIMITKLVEKNKTKCECYLPNTQGTFGNIAVSVQSISEKNGYTLRRLLVRYGEEEREILHYWYSSWPDHKTPEVAKQLLELAKEVELMRFVENSEEPQGPVVVHCSAGIGRTGCFIAMSIGMRQLQEEHNVDVLGIVCAMRLDRGGMVQTNEQYEFVHRALALFEKELAEHLPAGS